MKYLIILVILISCNQSRFAQTEKDNKPEEVAFISPKSVYPKWTEGSNEELIKLISSKIIYPSDSLSGTTYLQFKIDTFGNVKDVKIERSVSTFIDTQLMKEIVKLKFIPGEYYNRKTETTMVLPFKIKKEGNF